MSEHDCLVLTPGCFRCELNIDEIEAFAEEVLVVTKKGVVHEYDCAYVAGSVTSTATPWSLTRGKHGRLATDRPCSRCMPNGLPAVERTTT